MKTDILFPFKNGYLENGVYMLQSRKKVIMAISVHQLLIQLLAEEVLSLSSDPEERIAMVKKSIMNGWKGFYPVNKQKKKETSKNRFNNFHQRDYDFADYERRLLKQGAGGDEAGRKRIMG